MSGPNDLPSGVFDLASLARTGHPLRVTAFLPYTRADRATGEVREIHAVVWKEPKSPTGFEIVCSEEAFKALQRKDSNVCST